MASNVQDNERKQDVRMEDVVEVGSRVSWGAILAGAVMALAIGFVFTLLGAAIGLSFADSATTDTLSMGAAIWAIATTILALFVGGWITSQCVVGETKTESVVHGIIMWGVALAMLMWLTASGIGAGFNSMMQVANVAGVSNSQQDWQSVARSAGVPQETIQQWEQQAATAADRADDPDAQRQAHDTATQATWWTLGGVVLSLLAAIAGALVGAGPTFRLLPLHVTHRHMETRTMAS